MSQALGIAQEQGTDHQLLRDIQERIEVASIQLQIFQDLNRVADEELRRQAQWQLDQELFSNNDVRSLLKCTLLVCIKPSLPISCIIALQRNSGYARLLYTLFMYLDIVTFN